MPRIKYQPPAYRLHRSSAQAVVTLNGHDDYLGKYDSVDSKKRYKKLIAEWYSGGCQHANDCLTINELFVAYWHFVEDYYVKNGKPTGEQQAIKYAIKPLVEIYGTSDVREFGPRALKVVRQKMIEADLVRTLINARVKRIRRMFKWGVEDEYVNPLVLQSSQALAVLRRGRGNVRES